MGLKGAQRVYAPYLWYLQAEGVLDKALDDCLSDTATRAQMAHVLANLLPETALPLINDSLVTQAYASRRRITDVTEYTPYYQDILRLYRCGISIGSDETGSFLPEAPITRGAAAAHAHPDRGSRPAADAIVGSVGSLQCGRRGL